MKTWSDLQAMLQELMGETVKIWYQPPENTKLKYPCIIFGISNALIEYADNNPYQIHKRYTVTLMTRTADNHEMLDKLLNLPLCTFDREFINDDIVHDVFTLYF